MSTTTIRLEDDLKARINAAAAQAGKTAHAFILEAIAQTLGPHPRHGPNGGLGRRQGLPRLSRPGRAPPQARCTPPERVNASAYRHMTRIELAPEVLDDFDRFFEHIAQYDPESAPDRIGSILEALQILAHSPQIGRPVQGGKRELVIGRASRGYVALYHYVEAIDTVFVLAVRSQREAGFKR